MNNAPPAARMPAGGTEASSPSALVVSVWPPGKCWQVVIGWNSWRRVTVNASPRGCRSGTAPPAGRPWPLHVLSAHRGTDLLVPPGNRLESSLGTARRFDLIRVEDLQITNMTRSATGSRGDPGRNVRAKAGLNRGILASGWGQLARRLEDKAPGRVEKVRPAFTSQRCSACGQVDPDSRESQARFVCTACGFACHADVNAAINIAAGHPTHLPIPLHSRGGFRDAGSVNREPQLLASLAGRR